LDSYPDPLPPRDKSHESPERIHRRMNRGDFGEHLNRGRNNFLTEGQEKKLENQKFTLAFCGRGYYIIFVSTHRKGVLTIF
jgi:hypothetical protein